MNKTKNGEMRLANVKNNQRKFKSYIGKIKKRTDVDQKSKKTLCIILKCFTKQEKRLLNFLMVSEAKTKATKGIGLKILTSKQMLQRLSIAPAKVKVGNNSESLLNEIRQIVYSLYQSQQITKKVYNNIIKSI